MTFTLAMCDPQLVATNTETRTIAGTVCPYGVPGHTSGGQLAVKAGALTWPADLRRIKLLMDHDRTAPIGRAISVDDTPAGLMMTFKVGRTPAGDRALLEASEGIRDALSVELDDVTIRAGDITAGTVVAVAQVALPAYEDARIDRIAASQTDPPAEPQPAPPAEPQPAPPAEPQQPQTDPDQERETMPDTIEAGLVPAEHRPRPAASLAQITSAVAGRYRGERLAPDLSAALIDITHTGNAWAQSPQFVDELWSGVPYARRVVPLVNNAPLTGYTVNGWRWVDPPTVAPYAGDKADVPSDTAVTEAVTATAERLAGAHDVDRAFFDFGDTGFITSYFAAMAASYALKSDQALTTKLLAADAAATAGPEDLWGCIIAGVMEILSATGADATFALVNGGDLATAAGTPVSLAPAWLPINIGLGSAESGMSGLRIVPISTVPAGTVLVGARSAATYYELSGSPIRVEAVSLPDGGFNVGVFGYFATVIHNPAALAKVTITTVP